MNMQEFSRENRARCEAADGFRHPIKGWSLSEWLVAVQGELGEACGVVKEMNRARDGVPGKGLSQGHLLFALGEELADVYIYLDLLTQAAGLDLATCVREKFERTSEKIGYATAPSTARSAS
jgi:NTP pyrophosphatase (non-canonical NTP hydrolase)